MCVPVKVITPQHRDKHIPKLHPQHPRETVCDVPPDDIQVVRDRMSNHRDQDVPLLWIAVVGVVVIVRVAECLKVGGGSCF